MATIQNRSRITVTVKNRHDITRSFSYDALDKVEVACSAFSIQSFLQDRPVGNGWIVQLVMLELVTGHVVQAAVGGARCCSACARPR